MAQNLTITIVPLSTTSATLVFSGTGKVQFANGEGGYVLGVDDTITFDAANPVYFSPPPGLEFNAPAKLWAIGHPAFPTNTVRVVRWY